MNKIYKRFLLNTNFLLNLCTATSVCGYWQGYSQNKMQKEAAEENFFGAKHFCSKVVPTAMVFKGLVDVFGKAISLYSQLQLNQPPTLWLSDMYWLLNSWAINVRQLPSAQIQLRIPSLMTNEKSFANFGNSALNQSPTYCRERNISIPVIKYVCMYKNQGF